MGTQFAGELQSPPKTAAGSGGDHAREQIKLNRCQPMPTYDYHCEQCGRDFSVQMTIEEHSRKKERKCPKCGSRKIKQKFGRFFAKTTRKS